MPISATWEQMKTAAQFIKMANKAIKLYNDMPELQKVSNSESEVGWDESSEFEFITSGSNGNLFTSLFLVNFGVNGTSGNYFCFKESLVNKVDGPNLKREDTEPNFFDEEWENYGPGPMNGVHLVHCLENELETSEHPVLTLVPFLNHCY
ncbi:hypothetical protein OBBRIDRAFT_804075 [Obba rivulosa]|uniref:Uncharacterized protein n=1 Tax=Obba rivulosa TaxID=1052685 RepID=A0A8E2DNL4_9APHY|nr:hypothetical protein OBBRIDRAFT_804075 [Obba rivulosa]